MNESRGQIINTTDTNTNAPRTSNGRQAHALKHMHKHAHAGTHNGTRIWSTCFHSRPCCGIILAPKTSSFIMSIPNTQMHMHTHAHPRTQMHLSLHISPAAGANIASSMQTDSSRWCWCAVIWTQTHAHTQTTPTHMHLTYQHQATYFHWVPVAGANIVPSMQIDPSRWCHVCRHIHSATKARFRPSSPTGPKQNTA